MKQHWMGLGGLCASTAIALVASGPAWGEATQVTGVNVAPSNGGMTLILQTSSGDRPQIFVVEQGNELVADLIDTRLNLPEGGFRQDNPSPGIASVVVTSLDSNSTRVIVSGISGPPSGEVIQQDPRGIIFNYQAPPGSFAAAPSQASQFPAAPPPVVPPPVAQVPPRSNDVLPPNRNLDILVPDPEITIDGAPIDRSTPINPAPPVLPRAVPPPVGDIAISNIDPSPSRISLGTAERVPRLVLKDAPVQDVLALLARAAGMNLAFFEGNVDSEDAEAAAQLTISLDIENESVQDVFNNVLRLSGLQANQEGTTIIVGRELPDGAQNLISRTLRLNQVGIIQARDFLISQGAEANEIRTREQVQTISTGPNTDPIVTRNVQTQVELLAADSRDERYEGFAPLPLRGILVSIGRRGAGDQEDLGNEITLVGEPRKVEIATALITQLETRRPQVAVNVKIVDVNLINDENFSSSFSFGVGDTFVTVDQGSAVINFGGTNPPSAATSSDNLFGRPVIENPFQGADIFLDPNNPVAIPQTRPDTLVFDENGSLIEVREAGPGIFPRPDASVSNNPLEAGFSDIELAEDTIITQTQTPIFEDIIGQDGEGNPIVVGQRFVGFQTQSNVSQGSVGSVGASIVDLFQFPKRFLSTLQAQVISGNAKILTDPTLVIQEGQTANVNLTQQVVQRIDVDFSDTASGTRETREVELADVGLQLAISVNRIDDNGFVTLEARPTVSSIGNTVDLGEGEFALIQNRSVDSGRIRMRDGQTLILSGIIQDSERTTVSKVPILGDLPLIGALFRSTGTENMRSEVIVLLTPNIIQDSEFSTFGYGYTPGPEAREILQQNGQGNILPQTQPR